MPVTLDQFIGNLTRSGLFTAEELAAFQESLPPERRPTDVQSLARELVQAHRLTKYQAAAIYQGKTKGLVLDEYVILEKIASGGMGKVYKAEHRRMKRLVAVKVLPSSAMESPDAVRRFYREVQAAAQLSHPNIVTAYDARESEGVHYLAMELVEGRDLGRIVKHHGPLSVAWAVDYVIQAARGLEYAHSRGVVHRDVKPGNLLLDTRGTVKILDMGLARLRRQGLEGRDPSAAELTDSDRVMGTIDYMSPEQAEETHQADHRSDVYSLGCTLYRLLTGNPPYTGTSPMKRLLAHREAPIPSLCAVRPDVPSQLDAVFQRMVAKKPKDRYQSMGDVIAALDSFAATGDAPADEALSSFLKQLTLGDPGTKPALPIADDTHLSRDEETDESVTTKVFRAIGRRKLVPLGVVVAVGLAAALALWHLLPPRGPQRRAAAPPTALDRPAASPDDQRQPVAPGDGTGPDAAPQFPASGDDDFSWHAAWIDTEAKAASLVVEGRFGEAIDLFNAFDEQGARIK